MIWAEVLVALGIAVLDSTLVGEKILYTVVTDLDLQGIVMIDFELVVLEIVG